MVLVVLKQVKYCKVLWQCDLVGIEEWGDIHSVQSCAFKMFEVHFLFRPFNLRKRCDVCLGRVCWSEEEPKTSHLIKHKQLMSQV
jgi:hypothetical protein